MDAAGLDLLRAKLACDETGRLNVADQFFHKIEVIRWILETEGRRLRLRLRDHAWSRERPVNFEKPGPKSKLSGSFGPRCSG